MSSQNPRIGFVCWNQFQMMQFMNVARLLDGACFIFEQRSAGLAEFEEEYLAASEVPWIVWPRNRIRDLDGVFDVLVCQTVFSQMERITTARIAMLQYGLAKEVHNYGAWRAFGHLCLAYGEYSAAKMSYFCPTELIGNPRFDGCSSEAFKSRCLKKHGAMLDEKRKTILYVPTWGDLNTSEHFIDSVATLSRQYNVLLKLHHNTENLEASRKESLRSPHITMLNGNEDLVELLVISDVVLSDYSGAIFDALFFEKPVILLHRDIQEMVGHKLDKESLEYARSAEIGPVIYSGSSLESTVEGVLDGRIDFRKKNRSLCDALYVRKDGAAQLGADALLRLARGEYEKSQMQTYIESELSAMRRLRFSQKAEIEKLKGIRGES